MVSFDRPVAPTPYETWVRTMEAWTADPTVPLDHLPPLSDDTFTPQTYERLMVYVRRALEAATDRWVQELGRALSSWRTPYDLAHDLVQLRSSLARRVQLSRHPSLPPTVREILSKDAERSIERYQAEIVDSVRKSPARASRRGSRQQRPGAPRTELIRAGEVTPREGPGRCAAALPPGGRLRWSVAHGVVGLGTA